MCVETIFTLEVFLTVVTLQVNKNVFLCSWSLYWKSNSFPNTSQKFFFLFQGIFLQCFLCLIVLFWCLIVVDHLRHMKWSPCFAIDSACAVPLHFLESKGHFHYTLYLNVCQQSLFGQGNSITRKLKIIC